MLDEQVSPGTSQPNTTYSVVQGATRALWKLRGACKELLPKEVLEQTENVSFTSANQEGAQFPTPLRQQDATGAAKALEACVAAAIADLRYGAELRTIHVDLDKTACFLMSAYLTTIDGMDKGKPGVKNKVPDTDLNKAQSILYRRLSANLYETRTPGEYYHIHGSLDATTTLNMIGLPAHHPQLTEYKQCIDTIEKAVKRFTVKELEAMNRNKGQAGCPALTRADFLKTPHGRAMKKLPPLTVDALEITSPAVPFPTPSVTALGGGGDPRRALAGIKVLELCRVIAGPTIGRSLAAHGADVLKVTSPKLPDVPFFQLDVNTGKHCTSLDLRDPADRVAFESLLEDVDVVIDGYRPGALDRLGYGPRFLLKLAAQRGKGLVYVAEDCFGGTGLRGGTEWSARPGWQQIADCVTGVAWAQGPVVPPFPMSDYGTGVLGAAAAMAGLYKRAVQGGSWVCRTSLVQYDMFLLGLGLLPVKEQARLTELHVKEGYPSFFQLKHHDSVDEVGRRALVSMRRVSPHLFEEAMMHSGYSPGFQGKLRWPREAVAITGLRVGHVRTARPNGYDRKPGWNNGNGNGNDGWEVDEELVLQTEKGR
ncbi:formyl-CoA:oxalate CoA-transferase [Diplogelasinospora grovesii]|uniref:Formyl-CoA:oxalate CoA-transferase n=1 Tax=Diplogelasinospora grovesii TaxID=303347 RepID=A0AAN6NDY0_9PEZI|nr:formyl-CoA:oxalate CoA-transferase [Diplogelasinospora grovesii]